MAFADTAMDWVSTDELAHDLQILPENLQNDLTLLSVLESNITAAVSHVGEWLNRPMVKTRVYQNLVIPSGTTVDSILSIQYKHVRDLPRTGADTYSSPAVDTSEIGAHFILEYWNEDTDFTVDPSTYLPGNNFRRCWVNEINSTLYMYLPSSGLSEEKYIDSSKNDQYVLSFWVGMDTTRPDHLYIKRVVMLLAKRLYSGEDLDLPFVNTLKDLVSSHANMAG